MSSTVVAANNSPKSFLASGIPYLKFDDLPINLESTNSLKMHNHSVKWTTYKINSYRRNVILCIGIISKACNQWRLSNARISSYNKFEYVVVIHIEVNAVTCRFLKEKIWLTTSKSDKDIQILQSFFPSNLISPKSSILWFPRDYSGFLPEALPSSGRPPTPGSCYFLYFAWISLAAY